MYINSNGSRVSGDCAQIFIRIQSNIFNENELNQRMKAIKHKNHRNDPADISENEIYGGYMAHRYIYT